MCYDGDTMTAPFFLAKIFVIDGGSSSTIASVKLPVDNHCNIGIQVLVAFCNNILE